jgi:hypothetical protein
MIDREMSMASVVGVGVRDIRVTRDGAEVVSPACRDQRPSGVSISDHPILQDPLGSRHPARPSFGAVALVCEKTVKQGG